MYFRIFVLTLIFKFQYHKCYSSRLCSFFARPQIRANYRQCNLKVNVSSQNQSMSLGCHVTNDKLMRHSLTSNNSHKRQAYTPQSWGDLFSKTVNIVYSIRKGYISASPIRFLLVRIVAYHLNRLWVVSLRYCVAKIFPKISSSYFQRTDKLNSCLTSSIILS